MKKKLSALLAALAVLSQSVDASVLSLAADTEEPVSASADALTGDADGDGSVTLKDVMAVLKHFNLTEVLGEDGILTDAQLAAADVNSDGKTDTEDAVCILKFCHYRDTMEEPKTWEEIAGDAGSQDEASPAISLPEWMKLPEIDYSVLSWDSVGKAYGDFASGVTEQFNKVVGNSLSGVWGAFDLSRYPEKAEEIKQWAEENLDGWKAEIIQAGDKLKNDLLVLIPDNETMTATAEQWKQVCEQLYQEFSVKITDILTAVKTESEKLPGILNLQDVDFSTITLESLAETYEQYIAEWQEKYNQFVSEHPEYAWGAVDLSRYPEKAEEIKQWAEENLDGWKAEIIQAGDKLKNDLLVLIPDNETMTATAEQWKQVCEQLYQELGVKFTDILIAVMNMIEPQTTEADPIYETTETTETTVEADYTHPVENTGMPETTTAAVEYTGNFECTTEAVEYSGAYETETTVEADYTHPVDYTGNCEYTTEAVEYSGTYAFTETTVEADYTHPVEYTGNCEYTTEVVEYSGAYETETTVEADYTHPVDYTETPEDALPVKTTTVTDETA